MIQLGRDSMITDAYGNGIYELTEEDKELIIEHNKFYEDLFKFGYSILDSGFQETMKDYELTIYSMMYRTLELLDTLKVMAENSLINSGFIVLRSLAEISVQLCYIVSVDAEIKKRATILQMFDIKRTAIDESSFFDQMEKIDCYKDYIEFIKVDKSYKNWYSYSEGKNTTLEGLFTLISWRELYTKLYKPLCIETHQINHMETNIVYENMKFNFKPFRIFENHILLLNSILTIMSPLLSSMVKIYGNKELKKEWNDYEIRVSKYIESNHSIAKLQNYFNPISKWFG